jgi:hypothetical protein
MRGLILPLGASLAAIAAIVPVNCAAHQSLGNNVMTSEQERASLGDAALRALLVDAYVSRHPVGYDGPGEFFRANGAYQRDGGHGAIVAEGRFEIHDNAICVWGDTFARVCRRIVANGDNTYTFIDTANGHSVVMHVLRGR